MFFQKVMGFFLNADHHEIRKCHDFHQTNVRVKRLAGFFLQIFDGSPVKGEGVVVPPAHSLMSYPGLRVEHYWYNGALSVWGWF